MSALAMRKPSPEHSEASTPDREGDQMLNSRPSARWRPQEPRGVSRAKSAEGLQEKIEELEAENEWLKGGEVDASDDNLPPRFAGLTRTERRILTVLMRRGEMTRDGILDALYGDRLDCDQPLPKVFDVFLCKIRRKLKVKAPDLNITIETVWGRGFRLQPESRSRLQHLCAAAAADGAEVPAR